MKQRLISFDIAKAICMILVVIGHYNPVSAPEWYGCLHDWIYTFHMPLFMFASGYIYISFKREEKYGDFVLRKVKRLMLPYFVTSVLIITIKFVTQKGMYVQNPVELASYLRIFYYPEAGYFLWFIWALFIMFLIVPLFTTKMSRGILFVVSLLWHYFISVFLPDLFCINQALGMMMWFMLGVICFDWKDILLLAKGWLKPYILSSVVVCLFVLCSLSFAYNFSGGVKMLLPWLGIGAVLIVSSALVRYANRPYMNLLLLVGSSNYIIYLFHTTFEGFAKSFVYKIPMMNSDNDLMFIVGAFGVVLSGIVCPIIMHRYVLNRYGVTKVMFGLK